MNNKIMRTHDYSASSAPPVGVPKKPVIYSIHQIVIATVFCS